MPSSPTTERWYGELEARVRVVEQEVSRLREWRHNVPSEMIAPLQEQILDVLQAVKDIPTKVKRHHEQGDSRAVTMRDVYVFAAGGGAITGLGKFLHWF